MSQVQRALRWRVGLKGQRSGIQRTEYHRQFSWKKPATAASPILAAEQVHKYLLVLLVAEHIALNTKGSVTVVCAFIYVYACSGSTAVGPLDGGRLLFCGYF